MTGWCRCVASVVAAVTIVVAMFVVVVISVCVAIVRFFIRVIVNKTGIVICSRGAIMLDIRLDLGKGLCCAIVGVASVNGYIRNEPSLVLCSHVALSFIMEMGPSCLDCARRGCLVAG